MKVDTMTSRKPTINYEPQITVVVPTLNRNKYLVETVRQVLNDKFQDLELIVVDQSDEHDEETTKFFANNTDERLRYFVVTPKSGVAAKNFALHRAKAGIVIFLDDDIVLDPGCLTVHFEAYARHPDIGGTGGRVKQKGIPVTNTLLRFDKYALSGYNSFNYTKGEYTDTVPGGNMSVKRDEAIRVGGFDTNFLRSQHREESEFSARYFREGNKFYFEPKASITHLAAPYGGTRIKKDFADSLDYYKNSLYFVIRYCRRLDLPIALIRHLRFFALRKNPLTTIRRCVLFCIGFVTACKRCILPIRIVSREVGHDT